jgi:hypothetical protein
LRLVCRNLVAGQAAHTGAYDRADRATHRGADGCSTGRTHGGTGLFMMVHRVPACATGKQRYDRDSGRATHETGCFHDYPSNRFGMPSCCWMKRGPRIGQV